MDNKIEEINKNETSKQSNNNKELTLNIRNQ